ncbi:MAG: hypothetical protein K5660_08065 [Paludibacteraceae bacterium]|nr:hypothetical protein [Paludibacteraceae bacterium]
MKRNYQQPVSSVEVIETSNVLQIVLPSPIGKTGDGNGDETQYAPSIQYKVRK